MQDYVGKIPKRPPPPPPFGNTLYINKNMDYFAFSGGPMKDLGFREILQKSAIKAKFRPLSYIQMIVKKAHLYETEL